MVLSRVRLIRVKLVLVNLNPTNHTYMSFVPGTHFYKIHESCAKSGSLLHYYFALVNWMSTMQDDVGWGEAAWMSSIAIALVIVAVGIVFFVLLILTSIR